MGLLGVGISTSEDKEGIFSSTLAAGVNGGSAVLFIGTTGITRGDMDGSATDEVEGVESGVAIVEFDIGTE